MNKPYTVSLLHPSTQHLKAINKLLLQLNPELKKGTTYGALSEMMLNGEISIAKNKGKVIGIASLSVIQRFTHVEVEIYDLVVDEQHRRQGVGTAIVSLLIEEAHNIENVTKVRIASPLKNEATKQFYEKLGFKRSDTGYLLSLEIK